MADSTNASTGSLRMVGRNPADRRKHPRFVLPAMYTNLSIRLLSDDRFSIDGNAYDISEGGVRFEADRGVEPGTGVALQITLPSMHSSDKGPGRAVFVFANIVWIEDEDEPGPVKMAAVFTRFARAGDRERLLAEMAQVQYKLAA
jgi:hypothetical protein